MQKRTLTALQLTVTQYIVPDRVGVIWQEEVFVAIANCKHSLLLCGDKVSRVVEHILHVGVGHCITGGCSTAICFRLGRLFQLLPLLLGL